MWSMLNCALERWRFPIVVPWLFCLLFTACETEEGTNPYATWDTYHHPEHVYRLRYLSPPWYFVAESRKGERAFAVGTKTVDFDTPWEGIKEGDLILVAYDVPDVSAKKLSKLDSIDWTDAGVNLEAPRPFSSAQGHKGLLLEGRGEDFRVSAVYHDLDGEQGAISMKIFAIDGLYSYDIQLMLESFEPGQSGYASKGD